MNDSTLQGRPANMPNEWAAGINSLATLHAAIGVNSNYTESWLDKFITQDSTCNAIKSSIRAIAQAYNIKTILITGPSGHGKELLANALHWRPSHPFVPVNCAAIPETLLTSLLFGHVKGTFTGATEDRPGVFEAAGEGTVFLDEIGDMPEYQQCALLRILDQRQVIRLGSVEPIRLQCRIIAATNAPDKLRPDIFGRLMAVHYSIPPLSIRPVDIELIANSLNITGPFNDNELRTYGVRYLQALATRKLIGL